MPAERCRTRLAIDVQAKARRPADYDNALAETINRLSCLCSDVAMYLMSAVDAVIAASDRSPEVNAQTPSKVHNGGHAYAREHCDREIMGAPLWIKAAS